MLMIKWKSDVLEMQTLECFVLDYEFYICHVRLINGVGTYLRVNLIFKSYY